VSERLVSVFMGTPRFAVPALEALAEASELRLVVTQPDRPAGRGRRLEPPPVKIAAEALEVEVIQPEVVKGKRFAGRIAGLQPDLLVTAAFGRILGPSLLAVPRLGCLNVHASLLPRYRGAAPISRAILAGDTSTGVSITRMVEELDAGPVFHRIEIEIGPDETAGELSERLSRLGAEALVEVLTRFDELEPFEQSPDEVSWAPALEKRDGVIDWSRPAGELHNHVRGMHPWPCATTTLDGTRLKVHRAMVIEGAARSERPGTVLQNSSLGLDVACGQGVLRLLELQLPGRKRLDARQFYAGRFARIGTILGKL
jgi:methionyl-tRNA formyltransferase